MNIILTEDQYKRLILEDTEENFKAAVYFDKLYGTNLSHQYDFGPDLTSDGVWNMWAKCRNSGDCDELIKLVKNLQDMFPYYDVKKLTSDEKFELVMGMASEYNPADIVHFVVNKVYYENNVEQKRLEHQLPPEVADNIRWVLSPESMEQIRNKFGINEI